MFEETRTPKRLPSETHHVIVDLENSTIKTPEFDLSPLSHETIGYKMQSAADDFTDKIMYAGIVITTITPINAKTLGEAPYLKLVVGRTTGMDYIDLEECKRRGITVVNTPGATVEAVSEHTLALYFAVRKRISWQQNALYDFEDGRPNLWKEVVGMIGHGAIGKRIALLCKVLGMQVLVAERKGEPTAREGKVPFQEVLRRATVLMLALPLTGESRNLIAEAEMATMRPEAVIVNISRGRIANEQSVVRALRDGRIYGYGTDVFEKDPAGSDVDSVLLSSGAKGLNLALTPHLAWYGDKTFLNLEQGIKQNVELWASGEAQNVVV